MDGRGRCLDNIFIERVWRSLKYEEVYLRDYRLVPEARAGISRYFQFYNYERPHQSLEYRTPVDLCRGAPRECDPSADSSAGMAGAASAVPDLGIRPADTKLIAPEKSGNRRSGFRAPYSNSAMILPCALVRWARAR